MTTLVDFISFTVPIVLGTVKDQKAFGRNVFSRVNYATDFVFDQTFGDDEFTMSQGRAGYTFSWLNADKTVQIYFGTKAKEILCEIKGRGCERLRSGGRIEKLIIMVQDDVTRIDLATDFETDLRPKKFVGAGYSGRFRAKSEMTSAQGETCYVGSWKSDRFARVYRYNDPHPRSHLLRIEHVFRRQCAKEVARDIGNYGILEMQKRAGKTYEWKHELWKEDMMTEEKIPGYYPENKKTASTVRWLIKQCAPAFKRLVDEGVIEDPEAFIREHFLSEEVGIPF